MTGAVTADSRGRELERAFAFVDLAGFTALSEAHGDAGAAHTALRLVRLTREVLAPGVHLVKSLGDAVMLAAEEPRSLLDTVLALAGRSREEPGFLGLRAGLHGGTCVEVDGDYFGRVVNVAARVGGLAGSGQVLMTAPLARTAQGAGYPLSNLGLQRLRGVPEPVEVFALQLDTGSAEIDPVCRMRVAEPVGQLRHAGCVFVFCSLECAGRFAAAPTRYLP